MSAGEHCEGCGAEIEKLEAALTAKTAECAALVEALEQLNLTMLTPKQHNLVTEALATYRTATQSTQGAAQQGEQKEKPI